MTDTEVTHWLAAHARPIAVADDLDGPGDPESDTGDGVAAWIDAAADARVLALGPAVIGTRELAQLAGRLIDGLVRDAGVRTIALQASESGTTLLDDHVRDGTGSAGEVLESLGSWSWNTREVLDIVRGLAGTEPRVRLVGVDPRRPATAVRVVGAFLRTAAPDTLEDVADALADLALGHADDSTRAAVDRVRARLDQDVPALVAATSPAEHAEAVRHAGFLARAAELAAAPPDRADAVAERLMAEGVLEAVDTAGPDGKVVLWAQADHVVAREDPPSAGFLVRERLGDAYRPLVLSAGGGKTRALRRGLFGPSRTSKVQRLPAAPDGSLEAEVLAAAPRDPVVDLRNLHGPDTPPAVSKWAEAGAVTRRSVGDEISSSSPAGAVVPCRPGIELDGIAVVRTVHPAWAR